MADGVDPVWGLKLSAEELHRLRENTTPTPGKQAPTFKRIDESDALSADDLECMREIRQVLERHGKLERFGVTLLHEHFAMRPGEVLLEASNADTRRMSLEPAIVDPSDVTSISTQWYLGQSVPLSLVKCRTSMHQ